jgi:hypothetical protein
MQEELICSLEQQNHPLKAKQESSKDSQRFKQRKRKRRSKSLIDRRKS